MHLTDTFHHPTFSHSEVIVQTSKHTDKQTDAAENIHLAPLCYAGTLEVAVASINFAPF